MALYKDPICLSAVSKDVKGDLRVRKQDRQKCAKPKCRTLKVRYRLKVKVKSHKRCDKHPRLDGVIDARLVMATENDGHGRGVHEGPFRWVDSSGAPLISGRMKGITNAGTHRKPLDPCERCDQRGHMEGRLDGKIVKGKLKGCRVSASYVINYDPGVSGQDTAVLGTIEGVVICRCK